MTNDSAKKNLKRILVLMVVMSLALFYLNLSGIRILGSNVEKWKPEGNNRSHK